MAFYKPSNFRDYYELVRRIVMRKWIIVAVWVVVTGIGAVFVLQKPKLYRSGAEIIIQSGDVASPSQQAVSVSISERLRNLRPIILSRTSIEKLIADFNLYAEMRKSVPMDSVVGFVKGTVSVDVKGRDSFSVAVIHRDPRIAQLLADRLSKQFIEGSVSDAVRKARETVQQLQIVNGEYNEDLKVKDEKIRLFQEENSDALAAAQMQDPIAGLRAELRNLGENRRVTNERIISLREERSRLRESRPQTGPDPQVRTFQQQLAEARSRRKRLVEVYTDRHPDVVEVGQQIQALEAQLAQAKSTAPAPRVADPNLTNVEREIADAEREKRRFESDERELIRRIRQAEVIGSKTPKVVAMLLQLTRDRDQVADALLQFRQELQRAVFNLRVLENQMGERFHLQDPANLPNVPDGSRVSLVLAGVVVGGILAGICVAFVVVYFDQTVFNEYELKNVTDLPVLVSVADYGGATRQETRALVVRAERGS